MPASPPERLLTTTARSTFESLTLLYAEPAAPPALGAAAGGDPLGAGAVAVRVAFAGVAGGEAVDGTLAVGVSADVAAALAENMLGGAGARRAEELRDAVGEFANVVCGHVLSAAAGPAAVFSLAAPDANMPGAGAPDADRAGHWCVWLDVEGGRARVTLDAPATLFAVASAGVAA